MGYRSVFLVLCPSFPLCPHEPNPQHHCMVNSLVAMYPHNYNVHKLGGFRIHIYVPEIAGKTLNCIVSNICS